MRRHVRKIGGKYFQMYQTGLTDREEAEQVAAHLRDQIARGLEQRLLEARVVKLGEFRFAVYVF